MKIDIIVRGPQGAGKSTIAAAITELLREWDIPATLAEADRVELGDAIEGLWALRDHPPEVEVSTEQS